MLFEIKDSMKKLIIFDLDGTLAEVGKGCTDKTREQLKRLEEKGARIAFSSGKPCFYLCGFARQLDLKNPVLMGENGGMIQFGVELPPAKEDLVQMPQKTQKALSEIKALLEEKFGGDLWFQPNLTAVTPFPYKNEVFAPMRALLEEFIQPDMHIRVYEHADCFDIQFDGTSKGEGLSRLSRLTGIGRENMISVGDWVNDYSMFEFTSLSIGIHLPEPERVTHPVKNIDEALEVLFSLL